MSQKDTNHKDISRKEAIKKMGSYAAFAALGTMIILNPAKAAQQSTPPDFPQNSPQGFRNNRKNRNKK
tara:strand:+ start:326 stop:529 length:204 start_codon:yes stop_codon:yes gene_type:complete